MTSSAFSRICFIVAVVATVVLFCSAQQKDSEPKDPIPLESLLNGPDHVDMPWKVQVSEPLLMYQQQYLLEIRMRIPAEILDVGGKQHVLHFLTKVADGSGHWLEGDQYNRFEPTAELGKTKLIQCDMAIYLRPGDYTVAILAFDSTSHQANLLRKKIVIPPLPGDPLPELNIHIPIVEFPADYPRQTVPEAFKSNGEFFPIGQFSPWNVASRNPVRIDIVLNVSRISDPETQRKRTPDRHYPYPPPRASRLDTYFEIDPISSELALGRVLQVASVLSKVSPLNGCVFVTAIDPLRMKNALATKPAHEIDWIKTQKELTKADSLIDVRVLQNHKGPGLFLRDALQELASQSSTCGTGTTPASHYVVFIGPPTNFPDFSKEMRLSDVTIEQARFYYFRVRNDSPLPDDAGKVLKSANAKRLDINDPEDFRRVLASFLSDLRTAGN